MDWFPTSEVDRKRSDMAKLVRKLAEEQAQGRTVTFPDLASSLGKTNVEVNHGSRIAIDQNDDQDDNFEVKDDNQDTSATTPPPFLDTTLSHSPHISLIIKNELSFLSPVVPTTHRTRDRIASQAPLFASPANLWDNSRPGPAAPAGIQVQEPVRRKGRKLYEKSNLVQPRMVLFTAREYYSDKLSSDRLFDEFLEDEVCDNSDSEEVEDIFC